jgi:hypothetical protein
MGVLFRRYYNGRRALRGVRLTMMHSRMLLSATTISLFGSCRRPSAALFAL